ncbi:hypothetical protein Bbelb_211870 [Branchiostoma belcheri]|nr:hypothetical protein Bbelb_211870 [Branchiostoma belcheri]
MKCHLQRMDRDKWPKTILTLDGEGPNPRGHPRRKWFENIREDLHHLNLDNVNPQDRGKWRAAIKAQTIGRRGTTDDKPDSDHLVWCGQKLSIITGFSQSGQERQGTPN